MTNLHLPTVLRLLSAQLARPACEQLVGALHVAPRLLADVGPQVSRASVAAVLNLMLFDDLLDRVPTGRDYVRAASAQGRRIVFDHGALRTVALGGMGRLPAGEAAITRVLLPLGYRRVDVYPLERLGMTGRSYAHLDFPEELPQFFVSELHPERFSESFQAAVVRVTQASLDPLSPTAQGALRDLASAGQLTFARANDLLPVLLGCFRRQHGTPALRDYDTLLAESAEMAWIATEGNAFNHATDRVPNLAVLVAEQKALGRPLKDTIETSRSGRVRQTAFKADPVWREFRGADGSLLRREVPGSFYEFIQRERLSDPASGVSRLDLAFDSSNAQGIFKMTAVA